MADAVEIGDRTQFFLDYSWIENAHGVSLRTNPPRRAGIVLAPERPWEAYRVMPEMVLAYGGLYHMWYKSIGHYAGVSGAVACPRCAVSNDGRLIVCQSCGWPLIDIDVLNRELIHTCYAASADGINWDRPSLGLVEYHGSTDNNIIEMGGSIAINPMGSPEERFMTVAEYQDKLWLYTSPDGLRWHRKPKPVLPFSADTNNQIIYDDQLGKYVAFLRGFPGQRTVVRCQFDSLDQSPWPYENNGHEPDAAGALYITDELETVMGTDQRDPDALHLDINAINATYYAPGVYLAFPTLYRHYPPPGLDRRGPRRPSLLRPRQRWRLRSPTGCQLRRPNLASTRPDALPHSRLIRRSRRWLGIHFPRHDPA